MPELHTTVLCLTGDSRGGKSTVAGRLARAFGLEVLATGRVATQLLGRPLEPGEWGPDPAIAEAVKDFVYRHQGHDRTGLIDGYPRKRHQVAELLALQERGARVVVLWLHASLEEAIERAPDPAAQIRRIEQQGAELAATLHCLRKAAREGSLAFVELHLSGGWLPGPGVPDCLQEKIR